MNTEIVTTVVAALAAVVSSVATFMALRKIRSHEATGLEARASKRSAHQLSAH